MKLEKKADDKTRELSGYVDDGAAKLRTNELRSLHESDRWAKLANSNFSCKDIRSKKATGSTVKKY